MIYWLIKWMKNIENKSIAFSKYNLNPISIFLRPIPSDLSTFALISIIIIFSTAIILLVLRLWRCVCCLKPFQVWFDSIRFCTTFRHSSFSLLTSNVILCAALKSRVCTCNDTTNAVHLTCARWNTSHTTLTVKPIFSP